MDAQQINIETGKDARPRKVSDGELQDIRSDMLKAEDRIVEDVNRMKEIISPERIANQLVSAVKGELILRMRNMDSQKLKAAGDKIKTSIKDHPVISAFLGLGVVGGVMAYSFLRDKDIGQIARKIKEKGERVIGAPSEFGDQIYGPPVGEAYIEVVTVSPEEQLKI